MIDFHVAFDKLAQFQTADQVANYLLSEGVKGIKGAEDACPIARWMQSTTGGDVYVTGEDAMILNLDRYQDSIRTSLTPAMRDFVNMFDEGNCPELVEERGPLRDGCRG